MTFLSSVPLGFFFRLFTLSQGREGRGFDGSGCTPRMKALSQPEARFFRSLHSDSHPNNVSLRLIFSTFALVANTRRSYGAGRALSLQRESLHFFFIVVCDSISRLFSSSLILFASHSNFACSQFVFGRFGSIAGFLFFCLSFEFQRPKCARYWETAHSGCGRSFDSERRPLVMTFPPSPLLPWLPLPLGRRFPMDCIPPLAVIESDRFRGSRRLVAWGFGPHPPPLGPSPL